MNVKLTRLPVSSLGALASSTITISHKASNGVVANNVLLKAVEDCYQPYFAVFGKRTYSGMGTTVDEGDVYRDEPLRAMKSILKGYAKVSGLSYQADAIALLAIIDQLGGDIENMDYGAENEKLSKLIAEYDKEENQAKLAKIGQMELYNTLKTRNADFMDLYFQQNDANASLRRQSSATQLRTALMEALRNYYGMVTAMKNIDGWQALYTEIEEVVKTANNTVNKPGKSDETTPTTEK